MKFSIITPSFRNSDWLKLCVASVADQGVEHEHIVQDAVSEDGTLEWLTRDARVRAFVEKDSGMYDAINRGLSKARGELIAHLNCDEQYLPGALQAVAKFFEAHSEVDVLFGDAVVVNPEGDYLWHRKTLVPRLWHTWMWPLSTLTCATFFRRSVIDTRRILFSPEWKVIGDGEWMLRVIQSGARMAVLRRFTSVFVHTGHNLSLESRAQEEARRFRASAPVWLKPLRHPVLWHHRLRRWRRGVYSQQPFDFSLYTPGNPDQRLLKRAAKPTFRWRW
ncbi:MAG TPA: glycosyltransferase family 2 protein [Methylomirabilota bacterium]|nr:glycosyltransferase family 2 protein [Methylomirabilota bacterium]